MHINIKSDEAHRKAKELSLLTGESLTEAVTKAIEERLQAIRERKLKSREGIAERLLALAEEFQKYPEIDPRHPDEILYDEDGLLKPGQG